jgi:hypothetical protein
MTSKFTKIVEERNQESQLTYLGRDSLKWFQDKIKEIRNPAALSAGLIRERRPRSRFIMGGLYSFYYNPKMKADLPYYDMFPVVIPLKRDQDGFLGLNIHYLPVKYRMVFLNKLKQYAVYNDEDEIKRLRITYDILDASKRFREFRPCIKRYLNDHIRTKIITFQPQEWESAIYLPLQRFKGAVPQEIWSDSVQEIRKN